MKIKQIVSAALILSSINVALAWQPDSLFIFGDNLSDNGNHFSLYQKPAAPNWHGRYSNGPVWAEWLAYQYGLINNPSLAPNYPHTNKFQDFATGGATILWPNRNPLQKTKTLDQQVDQYLKINPTAPSNANALAAFWIGSNDFASASCYKSPFLCVNLMLKNLKNNIKRVQKTGVTHFLLMSLPDISQAPNSHSLFSTAVRQYIAQMTKYYNRNLSYDAYAWGMADKKDTYVFAEMKAFNQSLKNQGVTDKACLLKQKACSDPTQYYYWQQFYPTAHIHQQLASFIQQQMTLSSAS